MNAPLPEIPSPRIVRYRRRYYYFPTSSPPPPINEHPLDDPLSSIPSGYRLSIFCPAVVPPFIEFNEVAEYSSSSSSPLLRRIPSKEGRNPRRVSRGRRRRRRRGERERFAGGGRERERKIMPVDGLTVGPRYQAV